ncbi:hypothetical protein BDR22DRAFT_435083 [Usnea florida]
MGATSEERKYNSLIYIRESILCILFVFFFSRDLESKRVSGILEAFWGDFCGAWGEDFGGGFRGDFRGYLMGTLLNRGLSGEFQNIKKSETQVVVGVLSNKWLSAPRLMLSETPS